MCPDREYLYGIYAKSVCKAFVCQSLMAFLFFFFLERKTTNVLRTNMKNQHIEKILV